VIVYALWWLGARRRWVWTAAAVATVLVLSVGYSRLYLDAHWLSDVVGGVAGGMAYLLLCIALLERVSAPLRHGTTGFPACPR
jgi:membrane-associated phospholipid phosphatase